MNGWTRIVPAIWTWGIALAFLALTGLWMLPAQLLQSIPAIQIGPHFGAFAAERARAFLSVAGIVATAFALGALVAPGRDRVSAMIALATGFWIVAVAVLCIGAFSVARVPWCFAGLLGWLLPQPRQFFRRAESTEEALDGWAKAMLVCVVIAAALNLAGTLAPPFEYDELEYHLGALADYRRIGHIAFLPHNFYSNMPQLTEMLCLLAGSGMAAKLLHWTFGLLSTVGVYALAGKLWSRRVAATAAALFYCLPFVQDLSQTARVDLATTFFATLAFGAVLLEWPAWAAAMAGCAVATKWPAVAVVLVPVVIGTKSLRYAPLALAFVVPWLVKNWLLTGNPIYPLLYDVLPNPHWSTAQAAVFAAKHAPSFGLAGMADFARLAWQYSVTEPRAVPLLLMLTPLILLRRNVAPTVKRAGWMFVAAYIGWWALTFRPWRFLFPAFPLTAMVGAYALRDRLERIAVGVVLAVALMILAMNALVDIESPVRVPARSSFLQYALGQFSRDEFIARAGNGALEPIVWMNENLPASAKVLYVGEARAYYARQAVLWSTAFDRHPLDELDKPGTTAEQLHEALLAQGVTHVYVNFSELERLRSHYEYLLHIDTAALRNVLQKYGRQIHATGRSIVWELQ